MLYLVTIVTSIPALALTTPFPLASGVATVVGLLELPIAAWELSVGLWLTFRGFRADALARLPA